MAEANYEPLIQGGDDQGGYDNQVGGNPQQEYNDPSQAQGGEGGAQQQQEGNNPGEGQQGAGDAGGSRQVPVAPPPQGRRYDSELTPGKLFIGGLDPRTSQQTLVDYCAQWCGT